MRRAKGQTKVIFHGYAALAVAESHVGIGDTVHLSLAGAQWTQPREDVSALGKRADWDLEYTGNLFMEVHRNTIPLAVIDVSHVEEHAAQPPRETAANGAFDTSTPRISRNQELWSSPPFARHTSHPSSLWEEAAFSSFVEEDGFIPGKGRKRARFSRDSGSWRYLERSSTSDDENPVLGTASPVRFQQELVETVSNISGFERGERPDAVADAVGASKHPGERNQNHDDSAAELERSRGISIPPPPPILAEVAAESTTSKPAGEVDRVSLHEEGHQQTKQMVPLPAATAPRLLPLNSLGLPLISPLVTQQGAVTGYFPPMSSTQSEPGSGAEAVSEDPCREFQPDTTMLLAKAEASTAQLSPGPSGGGGTGQTALHPAGEIIDLTSPTDKGDDLGGEETDKDLQTKPSTSEDHALHPERPVVPLDEFEFLNDSPIDPQPDSRRSLADVHHRPGVSVAEMALPDPWTKSSFIGEPSQEVVPPHYGAGEGSEHGVSHSRETTIKMSQLEEPARALIDQPDGNFVPNFPPGVVVPEQDGVLPTACSAPQGIPRWAEALEISAREVEHKDLAISPPPFPFKQRWDDNAKKESKARQAQHGMQATHLYMSNGRFYDGAEDTTRSPCTEEYDGISRSHSERGSLNFDDDGRLVDGETRAPDQGPESPGEGPEIAAQDGSASTRPEINAPQTIEAIRTSSVGSQAPLFEDSDMDHGMIMHSNQRRHENLEVLDDVHLTDDRLEHKLPPSSEEPSYSQKLPQTSFSPSQPLALVQDTTISTVPSTKAHLPNEPHIVEHTPILPDTAVEEVARSPFSKQPDECLSRMDQLATPANTQEEVRHTQFRDLLQELFEEKPEVELPPSPENTQDLQDSEATKAEVLDTKEEKRTVFIEPTDEELKSGLQERGTLEDSDATILEETRRRRSSRLSGKMPLLAKDPSEIVSPYFTPKTSIQHDELNELPSSPPHRPLSPEATSRTNIVVLIPPPAEKSPLLRVQEPLTQAPSNSAQSPLPNRHLPAKGFTTPHSYYPSLSSLPTHFNDLIDILAVSTTTSKRPQRAKSGPKDYFNSLKFADSSCAAGNTVTVQLFRPYKSALPECKRGDILLLRGMKVQTRATLGTRGKGQGSKALDGMMLLSTESSAWAVFKFPNVDAVPATEGMTESTEGPARSPAKRGAAVKMDVQINGPPVEFGAEERAFARGLDKWWVEEGEAIFPDARNEPSREIRDKKVQKGLCEAKGVGNGLEHESRHDMTHGNPTSPKPMHDHVDPDSQSPLGDAAEVLHEHELRDGMAYGDTISPKPMHEHLQDHSLDPSHISNGTSADNAGPEEEGKEEEVPLHEHELRDGMAYGDTISPHPMHGHSHHDDDHHPNKHDNHVCSPVLDHHNQGTSPTIASPQDQAETSHILQNGISCEGASASVASTPLRKTAEASTNPSEETEEPVHGLRSGRKYAMSSSGSPRPGSSGSTKAATAVAAVAAATRPPRSSRAKRRRNR
jgi:Telomeric single stranded DNA binding POT1/CDC13